MKPAKLERAMLNSWMTLIGAIIMIAIALLIQFTPETPEPEDLGSVLFLLIGVTLYLLSIVFQMLYTLHTQIKQS